jgi:hypothetical protein
MLPVTLPSLIPATAPQAPALTPGTVMQAMVAQLIDELTLRLQIPGGATLDVKTDMPLPPGTRVQLAVEGTLAQPKILLTPLPASQPASAASASSSPPSPSTAAAPSGSMSPSLSAPQAPPSSPLPTSLPMSAPGTRQPEAAARILSTPLPGVAPGIEPVRPFSVSAPPLMPAAAAVPKALQAAVTAMVRDAVAKQTGLAPLMADVERALARPDLPPPVRAAAVQLLGLRLPTDVPVGGPEIKAALIRSGIAGDPSTLLPEQGKGLTAALTTLKAALTSWIADSDSTPDPKAALPGAAPMAAPLPVPQRANLPPPHRLGPTLAQPPAAPSLPEDLSPREAAAHLLGKTEGALARQTLLQIASLPDETNRAEQSGPRLTLDIPLATPQGTGVAQLRIEREAARRKGPDIRPVWRAHFSIDIEPIGPVHASIALFGERAAVTLYAERDDSATRLREGLPILEAGLRDAAFETGELRCRAGAPSAPPSDPGLFVDQAS